MPTQCYQLFRELLMYVFKVSFTCYYQTEWVWRKVPSENYQLYPHQVRD